MERSAWYHILNHFLFYCAAFVQNYIQELCQDTGDCNWFTYDSEDGACLTLEVRKSNFFTANVAFPNIKIKNYQTCTLVDDDTCSECVSGQRQCQPGGGEGGVDGGYK